MTDGDLVSARYIPINYFRDVAGSFTAVRERDKEIAARFGVTRFARRAIKGEWPTGWLQTRTKRVIDHLDGHGFVIVTFDGEGHYIKEAAEEVDGQTGKMGMTLRPRRRSTSRRRS
jgi:hypothetical protein